jgi:hypothetical protein
MAGPDPIAFFGRALLVLGLFVALIGLFLMIGGKLPFVGRLPGDIVWNRGNVRIYLPISSCLLISLVLSLLFMLLSNLRR